jgi:glutathione S-transferase
MSINTSTNTLPKLKLISFKLCPYVQRTVITLLAKGVPYEIEYIDLNNPPAWFKVLSPLGKVPVMQVNDDQVLFESSVIQEYVDEITPPSLHPDDLLLKAQNRAWIAFGGELMGMNGLHGIVHEKDQQACDTIVSSIRSLLERLEQVHSGQRFFNGEQFNLIDAAYAPMLMRFELLKSHCQLDVLEGLPKLQAWQRELMTIEAVQNSVVPELPQLYRGMISHYDGVMAKRLR